MSIRFVIDSASDFEVEEAKELNLYYLPFKVSFDGKEYMERIDITADEFYRRMAVEKNLPKTSQVTPYQFQGAFEEIIADGDTPIAITMSSKVSGTYSSAVIASQEFEEEIFVVDSGSGSIGEKILVAYAIELAKTIDDPKVIVEKLEEKKDKIGIFYLLDGLEHLRRGGRTNRLTSVAGNLMSVKPIVCLEGGEVEYVGKARGFRKGNALLYDVISKRGEIDQSMPYMLAYSGDAISILNQYKEKYCHLFEKDPDDIPLVQMGTTVGTHIGPNSIGVAFFYR